LYLHKTQDVTICPARYNDTHWVYADNNFRRAKFTGASIRLLAVLAAMLAMLLFVGFGCEGEKQADNKADEFEIDKSFERGPLTVHIKVDKAKISIADTIRLRLEAATDQGYEVEMPAVAQFLAGENHFGILDYLRLPDKLTDEGGLLVQREFRLEPFVSGTYAVPELKFVFREKTDNAGVAGTAGAADDTGTDGNTGQAQDEQEDKDKNYELLTEKIPVEVTSLLDEDRSNLTIADIKNVAVMPSRFPTWWIWAVGAVVIAAGAVVVGTVLLKRRKTKQVRIMKAAHELAYERLRKLAGDDLITAGKVKEFYERISDILRWYIEHRFQLKAPERTTEEFLQEIKGTGVLNDEQKEMLRKFLGHCDLVKFALYGPTKTEIQGTFDLTKGFVEATRITEKQVDITEQVHANVEQRQLRIA